MEAGKDIKRRKHSVTIEQTVHRLCPGPVTRSYDAGNGRCEKAYTFAVQKFINVAI